MSIGAHLIHRCDIRRASAQPDAYHGNRKTMATVSEQEPCRLTEKRQRVLDTATGEAAVVTVSLMLFAPDTDIRPGDQIANVVDERGETMSNADSSVATFRIASVLTRRGRAARHSSAELERIG